MYDFGRDRWRTCGSSDGVDVTRNTNMVRRNVLLIYHLRIDWSLGKSISIAVR